MTTDPAVTAASNDSREIRTTETPQSNTSPGIDPAVQAAAEAIHSHRGCTPVLNGPWCFCLSDAEAAVAAARPIIEAEVRAHITADIDQAWAVADDAYPSLGRSSYTIGYLNALTEATRIARGQA